MIVCINGSRSLTDSRLLERAIEQAEQEGIHISSIISGEAHGVDTLAKNYAKEHGIPFVPFVAEWSRYGKSAGFRRNEHMREAADALISVWDGESTGTKHLIDAMLRDQKPVSVYCKTLYVVRLAGHPYVLPDKFYGMFSSIKVIDLENIGAYEAPTRDDNHKIAVVLPQARFGKRNAGYFRQKMEEFTADYRI